MLNLHVRTCLSCIVWCLAAALGGCGGGSSNTSSVNTVAGTVNFPISATSVNAPNVVAISVESGPGNNVNIPYVSVTVCQPETSTCKTIDHVLLDTGSTGLRIFGSVLDAAPALTLPPQQIGGSSTITECAQFLNAVAWGSVKVADVRMGGKVAASVPIQVLDANFPLALNNSAQCGNAPVISQPDSVGANGILGLSLFAHDNQRYFDCIDPSGQCRITVAPSQQVQNPVSLFSSDNNGALVQLPALGSNGASTANGYLVFGVNTRANNSLGTANVIPVGPANGFFTTTLKGVPLVNSFLDSGSNGLYFNDPDATLSIHCNSAAYGFYCPPLAQNFSASIQLANSSAVVNFSIDNSDRIFQTGNYAFNNLGGTFDNVSFDWGLPFFFGRSVYTVIENASVSGVAFKGPWNAFTN